MNSILSELYHSELRPNERYYPESSEVGILLESFRQNEKWLSELLDGKAKEHLLELVKSEGFPTLHIGNRILVPKEELVAWIRENTKGRPV